MSFGSGGVRQRELRRVAGRRIGNRRRAVTFTRRDEARRHELAKQGGTGGGRDHRRLDLDVVARPTVEDVLTSLADQSVISRSAAESIVAGTTEQDVVAVAAIGGELNAGWKPEPVDDVIAAKAVDNKMIGCIEEGGGQDGGK